MEENQNNNSSNDQNANMNFNVNANEVKQETQQTMNEVKNTFQNTNFKQDTQAAKGFFSDFFKNPLGEIKKVATDSKNSFVKIAIIIFVVWLVVLFVAEIFDIASTYLFGTYGSFERFFRNLFPNILNIIKQLLVPILTVLVLSGLVYGFKKNKNKSFLTIASTILVAEIPVVIASIVNLLTIFGSGVLKLTSYFSGFCSILSTVLLYFAIRELSDEGENKSYFWKYALIIGIFYVVSFVLSYLGIYL